MAGRFALFAFNGDPMCFAHVILNALDLREKGNQVKVIIDGAATKLALEFENEKNPFYKLYTRLKESKLVDCFCKACSDKMGTLQKVKDLGFSICSEMMGHPRMAKYIELGYSILTF
ncbi:MAG: DsrE family protein [Promethearchaeota archaeon]